MLSSIFSIANQTRWRIIVAVCLLVSLLLQAYARWCGLLTTDDSMDYLAAAQSFCDSFQLLDSEGEAFKYWPPLFPVFLSLFEEPVKSLAVINFIFTLIIGITASVLMNQLIRHLLLRTLCLVFFLWGVLFMLINTYVWSELMFLMLMLLFFYFFLQAEHSRKALYFSLLLGFILCLQRNIGLFVIAAACLWYFTGDLPRWKQRFIKSAAMFVAMSFSFFAWNSYRAEEIQFGNHEFFQWIENNFSALTQWLIHSFVPVSTYGVFLFVTGITVILYVLRDEWIKTPAVRLYAMVVVTYITGISLSFGWPFHEGDRYMTVMVPLYSMVLFKTMDVLMGNTSGRVKNIILLAVVLGMIYPLARTARNIRVWHQRGCETAK